MTVASRVNAIDRVLALARDQLGMDVAWMSRFESGTQRFDAVSSLLPDPRPDVGDQLPMEGSFCVRVLDGRLPPIVSNALADPLTRSLDVTEELQIGAYVGVPVHRSDGSVRGMLCCTSVQPRSDLDERDLALLQLLAEVLGELTEREGDDEQLLERRQSAIRAAMSGAFRRTVFQPVVDATTRQAVAVEALSRFSVPPFAPDAWFADADEVGMRAELEAAAACDAMRVLDEHRDVSLTVNLAPSTIVHELMPYLLTGVDLTRLTVELTEHAPVHDYDPLLAVLTPLRAQGLRIAVDDAGAGYASFRHLLVLKPDLIKIDLSLVRDVHIDPVRQALVTALVTCAETAEAELVAEGVEQEAELVALKTLGVRYVQGYLFGQPSPEPVAVGQLVRFSGAGA